MGQLRALQEELKKILFIGSDVKTSPYWKEGLPKRLQVYRNTVHGNAYDTLDSDYPLTRKQFTEDDWLNLSREFFRKHPPSFWELNGCITGFPDYLRKKKAKAYIAELAEYELTDLEAFIHTAVIKKGLGRTNPGALTRVFHYRILDWVLANAEPGKKPIQQPEVLIFYRNARHEGHIRRADPLMLLLMDHFSRPGANLASAEPTRAKLLPKNTVPLENVLEDLVRNDLTLL